MKGVIDLAVKEVIQERAKQAAQEYKVEFINQQKEKYDEVVEQYEELLTEYYQLEIRLEFAKAIHKLNAEQDKSGDTDKLAQRQIVLLKKIKDIENSGTLESYDAVMEAIKAVNKG